MHEESSSPSRSSALMDLLLVFIPSWMLILARDASDNEWLATIGRVVLIGLTLWVVHWRGGDWRRVGIKRPTNIIKTISIGIGIMVIGILVASTAEQILLNLPGIPVAEADLSRFADLQGNLPLLFFWLVTIWTTVAFGEELIWRGFLMDRLASVLGGGLLQDALAVLMSAFLFGLAHFYQGTLGMITAGLLGLTYVLAYRLLGRNLWVVIIAHGLTDTVSFVFLYLGRM